MQVASEAFVVFEHIMDGELSTDNVKLDGVPVDALLPLKLAQDAMDTVLFGCVSNNEDCAEFIVFG